MTSDPIRLGAVGLGRGFALSARALAAHDGISLVAAATRSEASRTAFTQTFGGTGYEDYGALLADARVEMIYVATPHGLHRQHVCAALEAGKHVVVEKPMAIAVADAEQMVETADRQKRLLLVGPSHSYDPPVALAAEITASGRLGAPKMVHCLNATDFLYRPRRPEELCTEDGGGVIFSQAIHQIDVAMRLLGQPESVFASTGQWDADRATEGAYTAILRFKNGATASLTYSGYGFFDSDRLMYNTSELGVQKPKDTTGAARRALFAIEDETAHKKTRAFLGLEELPEPTRHEHFGPVVVFCEKGDIELTPNGVVLNTVDGTERIDAPYTFSRQGFSQALVDALRGGSRPVQDGKWGLTALKACHAMLASAGQLAPVFLKEI